jgi:hypothetical protein
MQANIPPYCFYCVRISLSFFLLYSSLAVGTKTGYRLFSLSSVDNLEQIYENGECGGYKMLQYSCSGVGLLTD